MKDRKLEIRLLEAKILYADLNKKAKTSFAHKMAARSMKSHIENLEKIKHER